MGQFFYVITLDQHVIHRRTRVINLKSQLSRSLDPPGGDTLLAQGIYLTDSLYIYNCRQYCFGLLGLISAVLMSRMEMKLINPPQMSHTCGTSKPCQSAQTSELVSMRNC